MSSLHMSGNATAAPAPDFDRLAKIYRWMEWLSFGPWLSRCRQAFLDQMEGPRNALVIGDGDGRFTAALLRVNPEVQIDAVDASRAMAAALLRRAGPDEVRVRTHVGDAREWEPPVECRYELVATHFFLDCLTTDEVRTLAAGIGPALAGGARWVLSEFDVPQGPFGRLIARPLIAFLYIAFGLLTGLRVRRLPDFRAALRGTGLRLVERRRFLRGLLVGEMWAADRPQANVTSVLKSVG